MTRTFDNQVLRRTKYVITGRDARLKRFKPIHTNTPQHYNIYRGTCWEILPNGRRMRLWTWWN